MSRNSGMQPTQTPQEKAIAWLVKRNVTKPTFFMVIVTMIYQSFLEKKKINDWQEFQHFQQMPKLILTLFKKNNTYIDFLIYASAMMQFSNLPVLGDAKVMNLPEFEFALAEKAFNEFNALLRESNQSLGTLTPVTTPSSPIPPASRQTVALPHKAQPLMPFNKKNSVLLGEGAYGRVYKVACKVNGRINYVAMKVPRAKKRCQMLGLKANAYQWLSKSIIRALMMGVSTQAYFVHQDLLIQTLKGYLAEDRMQRLKDSVLYLARLGGFDARQYDSSDSEALINQLIQHQINNLVAKKVLAKDDSGMISLAPREEFLREVSIFQHLEKNPHVVHLVGYNEYSELMQFEYAQDYQELYAFLSKLDAADAAGDNTQLARREIVRNVASAVESVLSDGVFHRDIKPENILVNTNPSSSEYLKVKLIDFGFSCRQDDKKSVLYRRLGTPLFLAESRFKPGVPTSISTERDALVRTLLSIMEPRPRGRKMDGSTQPPMHVAHQHGSSLIQLLATASHHKLLDYLKVSELLRHNWDDAGNTPAKSRVLKAIHILNGGDPRAKRTLRCLCEKKHAKRARLAQLDENALPPSTRKPGH